MVVDPQDYESLMGKNVRSAADEEMGRITDVLIGAAGETRAAVIDFGGFLGVGSRKIAVDWKAIQFVSGGKIGRITLALTRNQVRLSPEYKAGEPVVILGAQTPLPSDTPAEAPKPAEAVKSPEVARPPEVAKPADPRPAEPARAPETAAAPPADQAPKPNP